MNKNKEDILRVYLMDSYIVGRNEFLSAIKELSFDEIEKLKKGEVIIKEGIEYEIANWDGI